MATSVFDIFKIGIGPSSSHTVGPMRAAREFVSSLKASGKLASVQRVKSELYGSLGATGKGHGSHKAVILGLEGEAPETVNVDSISQRIARIREQNSVQLLGEKAVEYIDERDLILHRRESLPYHANGMKFTAFDSDQNEVDARIYYSVGGGFVVDEEAAGADRIIEDSTELPYRFTTAAQLLELSRDTGYSISKLMLENEKMWHSEQDVRDQLLNIWQVMDSCIERGIRTEGILPGGLKVRRRAPQLHRQLGSQINTLNQDPLVAMDWVSLFALAVNEENAGGGRVVTAPTNGAAGIIPAVMRYYRQFCNNNDDEMVVKFLLTAAAIGILYKENASISGAEVGCQGEVGSACSMAAGALTEILGGTPEQVENAAEIAMEHNLGLTCDPIGGLVQVPCIERNAMASVKAISAARMALRGDGKHFVSLDKVIKTMRDTGRDMQDKYKETARGGLAVNVIEVPVNIIEC
ncbi:MAG: L-serine ammonia-lyase [Porticoccaceae bacterium]|nr:L-serine ammonia-lyase [Porticoccaceae bacterium]